SLEFANGAYSAHAIQQRSRTPTMPSYPGEGSPRTAAVYFLKLTRLNLGEWPAGTLVFTTAVVALLCGIYFSRHFLPSALLWPPALSHLISTCGHCGTMYLPEWWTYRYYNVCSGLQLLPAVAVFVALANEFLGKLLPRRVLAAAIVMVAAFSYASLWRASP